MFLDGFTETTNPDNRFNFLKESTDEEVIIGGDCVHVFELDFLYSQIVASAEIIYRQGLNNILTFSGKDKDVEIIEDILHNKSYISLHLTSEDTLKFKETLLEAFAQVKLKTVFGQILYTDIKKVKIHKPLVLDQYKITYISPDGYDEIILGYDRKTIELPEVTSVFSDYISEFYGWSTSYLDPDPLYKPGDTIAITDGMTLFAIDYDPAGLFFETEPVKYNTISERLKAYIESGEEVGDRYAIPLFKFTNIKSRPLKANEVFITANADYKLYIGQEIKTSTKSPWYDTASVFEVQPDQLFTSEHSEWIEGELRTRYFDYDFQVYDPYTYDGSGKDDGTWINRYDIDLCIAEKRVENNVTYYTVKQIATNSLNAYLLMGGGSVWFSVISGEWWYGIDKSRLDLEFYNESHDLIQTINWAELDDNYYYPWLQNLIYGQYYKVSAESSDNLVLIDGVWVEGEGNVQDKFIRPEAISEKGIYTSLINNHVKPKQNVYQQDPDSNVAFGLYYMGMMTVLPGEQLSIGSTYTIKSTSFMDPLPVKSDIYINGDLVATDVKTYSFELTSAMVKNNLVNIKVLQSATKKIVNNLSENIILVDDTENSHTIPSYGGTLRLSNINRFYLKLPNTRLEAVGCSGKLTDPWMGSTYSYTMDNAYLPIDKVMYPNRVCLPIITMDMQGIGWRIPQHAGSMLSADALDTDLTFNKATPKSEDK